MMNLRGWEPGWRNASDFDEILQLRADGVTPCYLPKNLDILTKNSVTLNSLTVDLQAAELTILIHDRKST